VAILSLFFIALGLHDGGFSHWYEERGNLHDRCFGYHRYHQLKSKHRLAMAERSVCCGRTSKRPAGKPRGADADKWAA